MFRKTPLQLLRMHALPVVRPGTRSIKIIRSDKIKTATKTLNPTRPPKPEIDLSAPWTEPPKTRDKSKLSKSSSKHSQKPRDNYPKPTEYEQPEPESIELPYWPAPEEQIAAAYAFVLDWFYPQTPLARNF